MVELRDYLNPVNKKLKTTQFGEGMYGRILADTDLFSKDADSQIALIGIPETRNAYGGSFDPGLDLIRSYFYQLAEIPRLKIIDAGDLKLGNKVKDTYASTELVLEKLVNKGIIPVILGGSQDITVPIIKSISNNIEEPEITIVDSRIDADDNEYHSQSFVNQIHNNITDKLILSIIGFQSYFVPATLNRLAINNNWNLVRLGTIRNNLNQIEPIFRDSDFVSFDISAIRQNECPAASFSSPNGLYAEEACQLASLSGLSDKLKAFSIFEYQKNKDLNNQSAHLIAQIIWHFLYGISQRKNDYPKKKLDSYKKIYVKLEKMDADLVFYENQQNKRFWVEIPIDKNSNTKVISCSESDYQQACKNEIPDRIWYNIGRYLK